MDVEMMRKNLLAVKLKGGDEGRGNERTMMNKDIVEEERVVDLMPGAASKNKPICCLSQKAAGVYQAQPT